MTMGAAILFLVVFISQWCQCCHDQGQPVWQRYPMCHKPTFFYSLLALCDTHLVCECVCVRMCVCVCTCMCVCVRVHARVLTHMYVCVHACVHTCMFVCILHSYAWTLIDVSIKYVSVSVKLLITSSISRYATSVILHLFNTLSHWVDALHISIIIFIIINQMHYNY